MMEEILDQLNSKMGTNLRIAEALGVTEHTILNWKKRGIPLHRREAVNRLFKTIYTKEEMTADHTQRVLPDLEADEIESGVFYVSVWNVVSNSDPKKAPIAKYVEDRMAIDELKQWVIVDGNQPIELQAAVGEFVKSEYLVRLDEKKTGYNTTIARVYIPQKFTTDDSESKGKDLEALENDHGLNVHIRYLPEGTHQTLASKGKSYLVTAGSNVDWTGFKFVVRRYFKALKK